MNEVNERSEVNERIEVNENALPVPILGWAE